MKGKEMLNIKYCLLTMLAIASLVGIVYANSYYNSNEQSHSALYTDLIRSKLATRITINDSIDINNSLGTNNHLLRISDEYISGGIYVGELFPAGGGIYGASIGTSSSHSFRIYTNNVDRISIDDTGNVGIGTTQPFDTLTVNGTVRFIPGTNGVGSYKFQNSQFGTIFTIDTLNNRTGIGVNSPRTQLEVRGNVTVTGYINASKLQINSSEGVNTLFTDSLGNVGIGTVTPLTKLDVYGGAMNGIAISGHGSSSFLGSDLQGSIGVYGIGANTTSGNYSYGIYGQEGVGLGINYAGYFAGNVSVSNSIFLGGVAKKTWRINVCPVDIGVPCLGQYLYTNGSSTDNMRYWYNNPSTNQPASVLVYNTTHYCNQGVLTERSPNGLSRFSINGCVGEEFILGTIPYGSAGQWTCIVYEDGGTVRSYETSGGCTNISPLTKPYFNVYDALSAVAPQYELR